MRKPSTTLILLLLILPFILGAQDYLGTWSLPGVAQDGSKITSLVTIQKDGSMTVDFASDGTIEVQSTYTVTDGVVSMTDKSKESPCYGVVGKYRMVVSGNTMTVTLVEDPCDARRAAKMVMQRKQ